MKRYADSVRSLTLHTLLLALTGALLPIAAQSTGAPETTLTQIPHRIKHFIDEQTISGAVTLIAHGNSVLEFHALGMADIEANRPMQKDTIFQIMSMTKPVTAIGIMMLAEEGKLALRDPVDQYLPRIPQSASRREYRS
jgi:CubicO group peptidase (beta-lactamase class C family)